MDTKFKELKKIKGEFYNDKLHRYLYSTDASIYKVLTSSVSRPKDVNDIKIFLK